MSDLPIIFKAEEVRAIIDERKTQVRLVPGMQAYKVGDRLWVRETFYAYEPSDVLYRADYPCKSSLCRCEGCQQSPWRSPVCMPRWASRITLEITGLRTEKLNDITEADAIAEGVSGGCLNCGYAAPCGCYTPHHDHRDAFIHSWNAAHLFTNTWWHNPLVWVIDFKRVKT